MSVRVRVCVRARARRQSDIVVVKNSLWMLDILADWQASLRAACDCSLLYFTRSLLPAMIHSIVRAPRESYRCVDVGVARAPRAPASRALCLCVCVCVCVHTCACRLHYLMAAFSDAARMLSTAAHVDAAAPVNLATAYEEHLSEVLQRELIVPLRDEVRARGRVRACVYVCVCVCVCVCARTPHHRTAAARDFARFSRRRRCRVE